MLPKLNILPMRVMTTCCTFLVVPKSMATHGSMSSELDLNQLDELVSVILKGKKIGFLRTVFARSLLLEAKTSISSEK